jgi:hypothetical protein
MMECNIGQDAICLINCHGLKTKIFGTILYKGYCTNIEEYCPTQAREIWYTVRDNVSAISL